MPSPRAFTSGTLALELEGKKAGRLTSASGGEATADVVSEPAGPGGVVRKRLGSVRYADIEIACEGSVEKPLLTWTQEFLGGKAPRRTGVISTLDHQHKEVSRRRFTLALLTEVAFPALDATSKERAAIAMRMTPESTEVMPGSGGAMGAITTRAASWLASNFRLTMGDLDCTRVTTIASLTIRQPVQWPATGPGRPAAAQPAAALEVGDLVVTVPVSHAETWRAWHTDFVIKGQHDPAHEKSAKLELMAPNAKDVLLTVTLSGIGIYSLVADAQPSASDKVARLRASMYCEQVAVTTPVTA